MCSKFADESTKSLLKAFGVRLAAGMFLPVIEWVGNRVGCLAFGKLRLNASLVEAFHHPKAAFQKLVDEQTRCNFVELPVHLR